MKEPKRHKSCDGCGGAGIVIGPVDEAIGECHVAQCPKCAGTGAMILQGLRKGAPFYRVPKI